MDKFTLNTSLQFPVLKLTELVSYSEVKKPSGVAYIFLVLIKDSKQRGMLLKDVLINFGVPERLHEIFREAINDLIRQNLITFSLAPGLYPKLMNQCRLSDFSFTQKGEKIFADGYIPATDGAGNPIEKETKVEIFYDVAMNTFTLRLSDDLEGRPLKDASLTPEFFKQFAVKKSEEDFINKSKGPAVGIKKEEIVTKVETQLRENWTVKYDCSIEIDGDRAQIAFEEKPLQEFFNAYYNPTIVSNGIALKGKFKFDCPPASIMSLRLSQFPSESIKRVLLPKELTDIAKQKIRLMITKGHYKGDGFIVQSKYPMPFDAQFVRVNAQGQATAYLPGVFAFDVEGLGEISVPLALEISVEREQLQQALVPVVNELASFSIENYERLVKISECSKDFDSAYRIIEGYMQGLDSVHRIGLFSEMRPYSSTSPDIASKEKEYVAEAFEEYIASIKESDLANALKITHWIPKYLGISPKEVLDRIFANLNDISNPVMTFEALSSANFDEALVCSYVNPVPKCLKTREASAPSLVALISFANALDSLKKLTGIQDYKHFTIDIEGIDKDAFKGSYGTASSQRKKIGMFQKENVPFFEEFDGFLSLFRSIFDDINMLANALANPNNIKPEIIERKIDAGEYQYAFVNLSGKLESTLKTKYGLSGTLSDMLSTARKQQLIDKDIVSDLHDFREARNANVHPDAPQVSFTPDDLRRWGQEIFDLAKKEDEDK